MKVDLADASALRLVKAFYEIRDLEVRRIFYQSRRPPPAGPSLEGKAWPNWRFRIGVIAMKTSHTERDLDAEASEALEAARAMPQGAEKAEALKKAGLLRKAADASGIVFARRGRPPS